MDYGSACAITSSPFLLRMTASSGYWTAEISYRDWPTTPPPMETGQPFSKLHLVNAAFRVVKSML